MVKLQILSCLFLIICCLYNIYTETKRNKQNDELFKRLKKQWEENEISND